MAEEENNKGNRFVGWFASAVFSTIALVAITSDMDGNLKEQDKENKWAISAVIVALTMSALAVFAHIAKDRFVGTIVEGGLATIALAMWASSLSALMNPDNDLATSGPLASISNANLYFFSWGSFMASLTVFLKYLSDAHQVGRGSFDFTGWGSFAATSFIVMAVAVRIWKELNCKDLDNKLCNRTEFAFVLGAISGLFAAIWTFIGSRLPKLVNGILALCFLAAWVCGIVFLTFGGVGKAPAHELGNLYFFTWGSFIVSCFLTADGLGDWFFPLIGMKQNDSGAQEDNKAEEEKGGGGEEEGGKDDDQPADVEDPEADV